jgi:hypothetical protein
MCIGKMLVMLHSKYHMNFSLCNCCTVVTEFLNVGFRIEGCGCETTPSTMTSHNEMLCVCVIYELCLYRAIQKEGNTFTCL